MRILSISSVFPSAARPTYGVFVKERLRAVSMLPDTELSVIAPTPMVPPVGFLRRKYVWWKFPTHETVDSLAVVRPRYPFPPKVGGYIHPELMYRSVVLEADKIWQAQQFDIIDAHFVYPNGVVAALLGRRYNVPVVLTGRGADILRYPALPIVGHRIRRVLKSGVWCVALSAEIAGSFLQNGADPTHVSIIPNGVDLQAFDAVPQMEARRKLGLPRDRKIIVSVGNLQELKGFHLLVDALPCVLRQVPNVLVVIVGGAAPYGTDYSAEIKRRISMHGLQDHILLVGRKPHSELANWYSAADIFSLLSSREGSPNVLLEALACGTPAVTTAVGGMREELRNNELGLLLPERSVRAIQDGLIAAISRSWNRDYIRSQMLERSWTHVAASVRNVFQDAIDTYRERGAKEPLADRVTPL